MRKIIFPIKIIMAKPTHGLTPMDRFRNWVSPEEFAQETI